VSGLYLCVTVPYGTSVNLGCVRQFEHTQFIASSHGGHACWPLVAVDAKPPHSRGASPSIDAIVVEDRTVFNLRSLRQLQSLLCPGVCSTQLGGTAVRQAAIIPDEKQRPQHLFLPRHLRMRPMLCNRMVTC